MIVIYGCQINDHWLFFYVPRDLSATGLVFNIDDGDEKNTQTHQHPGRQQVQCQAGGRTAQGPEKGEQGQGGLPGRHYPKANHRGGLPEGIYQGLCGLVMRQKSSDDIQTEEKITYQLVGKYEADII